MRLSKRIFLFIGLLSSEVCLAQLWNSATASYEYRTTGGAVGYVKDGNNINTKNFFRHTCWGNPAVGFESYAYSYWWPSAGLYAEEVLVYFNNTDTAKIVKDWYSIQPVSNKGFQHSLTNVGSCTGCYAPNLQVPTILNTLNEYSIDTAIITAPFIPTASEVDPYVNSITISHSFRDDIFQDKHSLILRNVSPGGLPWIQTRLLNHQALEIPTRYVSRIFRFHDYITISSAEALNRSVIVGLKDRTISHSPGYFDSEGDSINVIPLWLKVASTHSANANWLAGMTGDPGTGGTQPYQAGLIPPTSALAAQIKATFTNTVPIMYQPGFSPANPFGPSTGYSLDHKTGEFTFSAQDTGLYLLAYQVEEYRNNQLLGDFMTWRLAMIRNDTSAVLPFISQPFNIAGTATFNAATQTFHICAGQTMSYTVKGVSNLSTAGINLSSNALKAAPGSTVSYIAQGTDSATVTFSWTPTKSDLGHHYIYTDAIDTACGTGHFPVHISKGVTIVVQGADIITPKSTICQGDTIKLDSYTSGVNIWSVLPGGDPFLPCTSCSTITVQPSVTTRYVLSKGPGTCGNQKDTVTVRVVPNFTIKGSNDTSFPGPIPSNYFLDVQVTPSSPKLSFLWDPWHKVDSFMVKSTKPKTTLSHNVYYVTVKDSLNCFTRIDTIVVNQNTAAVKDLNENNVIELYPNPFSKSFFFKSSQEGMLRLEDATGRQIAQYKILKGQNELKMPDRAVHGVYIASFFSTEGILLQSIRLLYQPE